MAIDQNEYDLTIGEMIAINGAANGGAVTVETIIKAFGEDITLGEAHRLLQAYRKAKAEMNETPSS